MTDDHIEPDAIERMIVRHEAESRILAQYFDMDYDVSIRLHDATAAMLRALRSENAALKAERDALRQLRIDHEVIYGASEASAEAEVVRLRERVAALEAVVLDGADWVDVLTVDDDDVANCALRLQWLPRARAAIKEGK